MCGRFGYNVRPEKIASTYGIQLDLFPDLLEAGLQGNDDVRPSQQILAIVASKEGLRPGLIRWGFVPSWAKPEKHDGFFKKPLINAQAEGVATKPSWRAAFKYRRLLIPASCFFEWTGPRGNKTKYRIIPEELEFFTFAGLWEENNHIGSPGAVIITTAANKKMDPIHPRMPAILTPDEGKQWLELPPENATDLQELLRPYPDDGLSIKAA